MRVLLVNDYAPGPTGGAEVHVGRLRDALRDAGDEVEVLHGEDPKQGLRRVLDLWDPASRRRILEVVDRFAPDVVHYHNLLNELSTSVTGIGVPSVLTVHDRRLVGATVGSDHGRSSFAPAVVLRRGKDRIGRIRLRRAVDATIAPSAELAAALVSARFPSVHHVPNFAPSVPPSPPGDDVAYVGALAPHKGPQVLVDAFAKVATSHPGTRLHLVGDGPLAEALAARVRDVGLAQRVCLHGAVAADDVPEVLRRAGLVVVPSLGPEGGGPTLVVIEAMAVGRPVIASDQPGVREGIDRSVGVVVPSGDAAALAAEIDRLLDDRPLLEAMGAAARRRAQESWSTGTAVARVRTIYREAADG